VRRQMKPGGKADTHRFVPRKNAGLVGVISRR
jgi:hypothetical protein